MRFDPRATRRDLGNIHGCFVGGIAQKEERPAPVCNEGFFCTLVLFIIF